MSRYLDTPSSGKIEVLSRSAIKAGLRHFAFGFKLMPVNKRIHQVTFLILPTFVPPLNRGRVLPAVAWPQWLNSNKLNVVSIVYAALGLIAAYAFAASTFLKVPPFPTSTAFVLVLVALPLILAMFSITSIGSRSGIHNGHYYLSNHGPAYEVTKAVYYQSFAALERWSASFPIAAFGLCLMFALRDLWQARKRPPNHLQWVTSLSSRRLSLQPDLRRRNRRSTEGKQDHG